MRSIAPGLKDYGDSPMDLVTMGSQYAIYSILDISSKSGVQVRPPKINSAYSSSPFPLSSQSLSLSFSLSLIAEQEQQHCVFVLFVQHNDTSARGLPLLCPAGDIV